MRSSRRPRIRKCSSVAWDFVDQPPPSSYRVLALAFALGSLLLFLVFASRAEPARIEDKRAEAQVVLAQIQELDSKLDKAVDAYNGTQLKLGAISAEYGLSRRHLKVLRANLKKAEATIEARLVTLYTEGESSFVEFLLGASSLTDFLDRIDTVDRLSEEDARIIGEIKTFREEERLRAAKLKRAKAKQTQLLKQRAARQAEIEQLLSEREQLYNSIKDEIVKLEAEEAERQRRLEEQARARLAARQTQAAQAQTQTAEAQGSTSAESTPADASGSISEPAVISEPANPAPTPTPPPSGEAPRVRYGNVVDIAMQYLGVPYRWGGASPSTGFDCSGFIMYVYAKLGVSLPHYSYSQYNYGTGVSKSELQAGDLVFFDGLGHNGIYIGGGQFIHAPHSGDVVKISSLSDSWYTAKWVGARRL